jgi:dUTPase
MGDVGAVGGMPVELVPMEEALGLKVRVEICAGGKLPERAPGAVGLDLHHPGPASLRVVPGARVVARLGVKLSVPVGYVGLVCPLQGTGVLVAGAPVVLGAGCLDELTVVLVTAGEAPVLVAPGGRVAQLLVLPVSGMDAALAVR